MKRPDGEAGIPTFTPGRLRHSVASWAIDSGADPAMVAAFLAPLAPDNARVPRDALRPGQGADARVRRRIAHSLCSASMIFAW